MVLYGYLLNRLLISDTTLDTITALLVHSIFVNTTEDDSESGSLSEYIVLWNNKENIHPQNGQQCRQHSLELALNLEHE